MAGLVLPHAWDIIVQVYCSSTDLELLLYFALGKPVNDLSCKQIGLDH